MGRTSNFCVEEIELLMRLIKQYRHVIECKKSDATTWKEKEEAWNTLAADFNKDPLCQGRSARTAKALKGKWENLKKNGKKKFALEKEELYKTGGGKGDFPKITQQDDDIKEIIGVAVTGIENSYDSDKNWTQLQTDMQQNNAIEIVYEDGKFTL